MTLALPLPATTHRHAVNGHDPASSLHVLPRRVRGVLGLFGVVESVSPLVEGSWRADQGPLRQDGPRQQQVWLVPGGGGHSVQVVDRRTWLRAGAEHDPAVAVRLHRGKHR